MITFFTTLWEWILNLPNLISDSIDYFMIESEIFYYEMLSTGLDSSVDFFTTFMSSATYLSVFESSYLGISTDTRYAIEALNIPEAIILVISAMTLRFIIRMLPFVG